MVCSCFCLIDYKISVDQTPLPNYINRLLEILVEEEQDSEADGTNGAVGPCMEYLLQHRVLDTMYTFARSDVCHYLLTYLLTGDCLLTNDTCYFTGHVYVLFSCQYVLLTRIGRLVFNRFILDNFKNLSEWTVCPF